MGRACKPVNLRDLLCRQCGKGLQTFPRPLTALIDRLADLSDVIKLPELCLLARRELKELQQRLEEGLSGNPRSPQTLKEGGTVDFTGSNQIVFRPFASLQVFIDAVIQVFGKSTHGTASQRQNSLFRRIMP